MKFTENELSTAFSEIVALAHRISPDLKEDVDHMLRTGWDHPLPRERLAEILTRVATTIREYATRTNDKKILASMGPSVEALVTKVVSLRDMVNGAKAGPGTSARVKLLGSHNGISKRPVKPSPVFQGREIPMDEGFVRTRDVSLWVDNERLDIHVRQFRETHGRAPNPEEVFKLLTGKEVLPGVDRADEFKVLALADSIATHGVRVAPILSSGGVLLDGNRRVAASLIILNDDSGRYSDEMKRRVEYIWARQLTDHTTEEDERVVVVSLNFEPELKEQWPKYVRAKKVYEDWCDILERESTPPRGARLKELKRELALQYGIETSEADKLIKLMQTADEFKEYHVAEREKEPYEAEHRAKKYFEYFDELSKGVSKEGGVKWCLDQDQVFRDLVFDLLYEGKFANWRLIRDLRFAFQDDEAKERLRSALAVTVPPNDREALKAVQQQVEDALTVARSKLAANRAIGANTRIKGFSDWVTKVPLETLMDPRSVETPTLDKYLDAIDKTKPLVKAALEFRRKGERGEGGDDKEVKVRRKRRPGK